MIFFVAFISGAALFYLSRFFPYSVAFLSILSISGVFFFNIRNSRSLLSALKIALLLTLAAAAAFFYANVRHIQVSDYAELAGKTILVNATAKSEAAKSDDGHISQVIKIRGQAIAKTGANADDIAVNLPEMRILTDTPLSKDRAYLLEITLSKNAALLNPWVRQDMPSGFAIRKEEMGVYGISFLEAERTRLNAFIKDNFTRETAAFLMSVITGERSMLKKETRDAFSSTGLIHILSISGSHFGLVLFILFRLFKGIIRLLPHGFIERLTIYISPSQISAVICAPIVTAYLFISDMSIPSVRAFIMIALFLIGLQIQRRGVWLNTLLIAAFIIILIEPASITDLSFHLSFIAVLCIGMVTDRFRDENKREDDPDPAAKKTKKSWILNVFFFSLAVSCAATVGTAPLSAYYFHYFPVLSPLTNLLITPFIGFIILPLALISSFVFLLIGIFPLVSVIEGLTGFMLETVRFIADWGFVDIKIP
ncbi:MAG: ComEC/Rec2 family competence protein, partial [Nitrospirae bacterium]|nr:ComEC/Rec2 family competence protein [Nitrospirota bacterium]